VSDQAEPGAFAVGNEEQYRPVQAVGDQQVVAPQFLADVDAGAAAGIPDGALYWGVEGWKGGYPALGPAAVSSFAAMDGLLGRLAPLASVGHDPAVVVFGNSAGGQFVNRYAAVGRGPDALAGRGLRVRFVISNPLRSRPVLRPARPQAGLRGRAPRPAPADPAGGRRPRGRRRAGRPAGPPACLRPVLGGRAGLAGQHARRLPPGQARDAGQVRA
jgi:hypothetical protein